MARRSWTKKAPRKISQRRKVAAIHGAARCFLDPKNLKFPICDKAGKVDCQGIMAAYKRARQFHHAKIAKKALRRAKAMKCRWY